MKGKLNDISKGKVNVDYKMLFPGWFSPKNPLKGVFFAFIFTLVLIFSIQYTGGL